MYSHSLEDATADQCDFSSILVPFQRNLLNDPFDGVEIKEETDGAPNIIKLEVEIIEEIKEPNIIKAETVEDEIGDSK